MKIVLTTFTLLILISCSKKNDCDNRFYFSNCNLDIPILQMDYSMHSDSLRAEIQNQFKDDLCDSCSWVVYKIPFELYNKQGFLKVMTEFDYPYCDCPPHMKLRYNYMILINKNNQLLVNGKPMEVDSLRNSIITYFQNVGNIVEDYPEKYEQVNFSLLWDIKTEKASIEKVLTEITKAHLIFVEQRLAYDGKEFCKLSIKEIEELKHKYPLVIEFVLGKTEMFKPDFKKI